MGATSLFCFLLIVVGFTSAADDVESKIVKLDQGLVRGYKSIHGDLFSFFGIPYATAPTGPDKFKAPLPAPTWTGIFEAVNNQVTCPQSQLMLFSGYQEDCLVATIFVPSTIDKPLPVIVFVHGGAYFLGSGNMATPYAMVNQGKFIAVMINYRLGVHGFLCLGTKDAPGNAGMKDQVAALRWVNKNIAAFGGDPNDVTINVGSAGASAVELLMLSETTKGLFNKVIPDSGNAVSVWSVQMDPIENAKRFARLHNVTTDDIFVLEEFYKKASYEQLIAFNFMTNKDSTFGMVPCVERDTGTEIFLKEAPIEILKSGNFPKLPIMIGFSNMEGLFRAPYFELWKEEINENFAAFLPADLQFEHEDTRNKVANEVKDFYFGSEKIDENSLIGYVNYFSDILFAYPALRTVKLLVESGNTNVYLYQYSYSDNFTVSHRLFPHLDGADHCSQSFALFEVSFMPEDPSLVTNDYKRMKSIMRKLRTNFILTGKPVSADMSDFPKDWPVASADRSPYMELDIPCELKDALLPERAQFWDKIYEQYYRTPVAPPKPKSGHSEL